MVEIKTFGKARPSTPTKPTVFVSVSYRSLYLLKPEKFMNSDRKIKYSGEELVVTISQLLGALSDSKYIGDTWNFVFETAPVQITVRPP